MKRRKKEGNRCLGKSASIYDLAALTIFFFFIFRSPSLVISDRPEIKRKRALASECVLRSFPQYCFLFLFLMMLTLSAPCPYLSPLLFFFFSLFFLFSCCCCCCFLFLLSFLTTQTPHHFYFLFVFFFFFHPFAYACFFSNRLCAALVFCFQSRRYFLSKKKKSLTTYLPFCSL